MTRLHRILIVAACLQAIVPRVEADDIQIGYVEGALYKLGGGLEESTFTSRGTALADPRGSWIDAGLRRFGVRVAVTSDARRALEELSVDIGVAAQGSYDDFSAAGDYASKLLTHFTRDSNSLHVILVADVDFGRFQVESPALTEDAEKLAHDDPTAFREKHGTHYIAQENRKASLFCVYSVSKLTSQQRGALKQEIQATTKYASVASGEATVEIGRKMESAARVGEFRFFAGGYGVASAPRLPDNKFEIQDALETLRQALGEADRDSSVAVSYTCSPYSDLGVVSPEPSPRNQAAFRQLAAQHLHLTAQRMDIQNQLEKLNLARGGQRSDARLSAFLQGRLQKIEAARAEISSALSRLRRGEEVVGFSPMVERVGTLWDPLDELEVKVVDDLSEDRVRIVLSGICALPFDNYQIKVVRISETDAGLDRELVLNTNTSAGDLAYDEQKTRFIGIADVLVGGPDGNAKRVKYYEVRFLGPSDVEVMYFKKSPTAAD